MGRVTKADVAQGLTVLESRFGKTLTPDAVVLYARILIEEGMTREEWKAAVMAAFRYSRFFPSPQELIEYARGAEDELAETDWYHLVDSLFNNGPLVLSDTGRKALASLGGWAYVREIFHPRLREEFLRAWKAHAKRERRQALLALPEQAGGDREEISDIDDTEDPTEWAMKWAEKEMRRWKKLGLS